MPLHYQDCFSCPSCGEPIKVALGQVKETYVCPKCKKAIGVLIWVAGNSPEPIDYRNIC